MLATSFAILVVSIFALGVVQSFYQLAFHPLAKFPGPKFAALSRLYEFYYHIIVGGGWEDQIRYIHTSYNSPIVRIGPNEVHVNDPEYYDSIFNFSPHLDKRKGALDNLQHTPSHAQHKLRRQSLEPFFSRGNIMTLEFVIRDNIEKLCAQLKSAKESSSPTNISLLYRCLTADFITEYCFGRNQGFLDDPKGSKPFFEGYSDGFKQVSLMQEFKPWERLTAWLTLLPEPLLPPKSSKTGTFIRVLQGIRRDVQRAVTSDTKEGDRRTIFTELPKNEKLPSSEKTETIMYHTAVLLIGAGLETSGHTLETATFHLNVPENSHVLKKLKDEVTEIWPNADEEVPSWKTLEKLPYLQCVLKESLRLSLGVSARLCRINHHEAMFYKDRTIPAGSAISMSQFDLHFDSNIFPDPWTFSPDRWEGEEGKRREKYLVSFSRGSRVCIGMNLAMAELNTTLAAMIRRFDFKLFETDRRDVDYKYDYFVPFPETGDKGVRVEVL